MKIQNFLKLSVSSFLVGMGAVTFVSSAHAQAVPTQLQPSQGTVDAGRLEERFSEGTSIPDLGESVEVQRAIIQNAPPNADKITFKLNNLSIEGVSAYDGGDLASIYQNQLGTTVSLADVYAIANRLTNKYRNEG